jgi:hypothetical protein
MTIKARHLFIFLLTGLSLLSGAFNSAKAQSTYHIYSGGFHFVTGVFSSHKTDQSYNASFEAEPHGWLGRLLPWKANLSVKGTVTGGHYTPFEFINSTTWRETLKTAKLGYNKEGKLTQFTEDTPKHGYREKKVYDELAKDTVDVLTAVLTGLWRDGNQACGNRYPVFDGKRRFDIKLGAPETVTLKKSRYSVFEGEAIKCTMELDPIAGFKKKRGWYAVQAQSEKHDTIPTIWIGKRPDRDTYEIIKAHIKTDYGSVFMHLTE